MPSKPQDGQLQTETTGTLAAHRVLVQRAANSAPHAALVGQDAVLSCSLFMEPCAVSPLTSWIYTLGILLFGTVTAFHGHSLWVWKGPCVRFTQWF